MTEMIQPKICAVCSQVLDRLGEEWIHTRELVGQSDHVAVPVDYNEVPVRTMCDFCYDEVPTLKTWTVPAEDFQVPMINSISVGGWAACETCAEMAGRRDWSALVKRYLAARPTPPQQRPMIRDWLTQLYERLEQHMTEEVRPWRAGDEQVPEHPTRPQ